MKYHRELLKERRHSNNKGYRQIKNGGTRLFAAWLKEKYATK